MAIADDFQNNGLQLPSMQPIRDGIAAARAAISGFQPAPSLNPAAFATAAAAPVQPAIPATSGGPDRAGGPQVPVPAVKPPATARAPRAGAAPAQPAFQPGVDGMQVIAGGQSFNVPWLTPFRLSGDGSYAGPGGAAASGGGGAAPAGGGMVATGSYAGGGGAGGQPTYAGGGYSGGSGFISPSAGLDSSLAIQQRYAQETTRALMAAASEGDPRNYTARLHALAGAMFGGAMSGVGMGGVNSFNAAQAGVQEAGIGAAAHVQAAGIGGAAGVREAELGLQGRQAEAGAQLGSAKLYSEVGANTAHEIGVQDHFIEGPNGTRIYAGSSPLYATPGQIRSGQTGGMVAPSASAKPAVGTHVTLPDGSYPQKGGGTVTVKGGQVAGYQ